MPVEVSLRRRGLLLATLLVAGCPRAPLRSDAPAARPTEAQLVSQKVASLRAEVTAVLRATDEALWRHWTSGQALDLSQAARGHELLVSRESLRVVRRAMELRAGDARALAHLERWLLSQLLTQGLSRESAEVANVEASAAFDLDGRDVALRDLNRLLAAEKSAVKRRALWAASLEAVARLDAALARRDARARELLQALDAPAPLELAALMREVELASLGPEADALLASTQAEYTAALERLSAAEVRLPLDKLTRADLPRLLRVPPEVDAAFPREAQAPKAVALLGDLGLYGSPGLTLDLTDASRKSPLPLTVAPGGPGDVRLCFRPSGGLRDAAALLSELGVALALHGARTGRVETDRLGDPGQAEVTAALLSSLAGDEAWLEDAGVPAERRGAAAAAFRVHRLATLRRAAGSVLLAVETDGLPEAEAREKYREIMTRALGVRHSAEDGVRLRLDSEDFLRAATALKAHAEAEALSARLRGLAPRWWKQPRARAVLEARWGRGTAEAAAELAAPPPTAAAPDAGAHQP